MLDTDLIKTLLDHDTFNACTGKLTPGIFGEDVRDIYEIVTKAHQKYGHSLTSQELLALWRVDNPVATKAERNDVAHLLEDIESATSLSHDVTLDVIETLWRRDLGKRIASLGLEMSEGREEAMGRLQSLLDRHAEGYMPNDFGDDPTDDLDELLAMASDENRFKFNIETLSRHVYGLGRREFGVIFATPNTGKTAFAVSLAFAPGGFIDQGRKVMFLGNEEAMDRTVLRAMLSCTGLDKYQIAADRERARQIYRAKTQGKVVFRDTQEWDLNRIEAFIGKQKPDVVIIDQLDKVQVAGGFDSGHERLRELYRRARETAKRYDCALLGVSQASNEASRKTRLDYSMMEGSKIGKAAEADLIIGIGKHEVDENNEPDNSRYLTVSKNKLSGWHGTVICNLEPMVSRYVE